MSTANGLGYLLGALGSASVVRRFGAAAALWGGMVVTSVSLVATAVSDDFAVLLATRVDRGTRQHGNGHGNGQGSTRWR